MLHPVRSESALFTPRNAVTLVLESWPRTAPLLAATLCALFADATLKRPASLPLRPACVCKMTLNSHGAYPPIGAFASRSTLLSVRWPLRSRTARAPSRARFSTSPTTYQPTPKVASTKTSAHVVTRSHLATIRAIYLLPDQVSPHGRAKMSVRALTRRSVKMAHRRARTHTVRDFSPATRSPRDHQNSHANLYGDFPLTLEFYFSPTK